MKAKRDVLEVQIQEYERQVIGLKSYIKELTDTADKHGTEKSEYEADLLEAEHNVQYYEAEIARLRKEMGGGAAGGGRRPQPGTILPRTARQGVGTAIFSAIGFVAGAVLGSKVKSKNKEKRGGVR
ncbi:MAG TPA: hypothetical protein VD861_09420 [Pyrinomonadaceae bacterium]|nr:hypothetical protein [Pyrinomonadaceae bacterium]